MGKEEQRGSPSRGATPSVSPVLSDAATAARKAAAPTDSSADVRTAGDRLLLAVCVAGIMGSYLVYGMLQEQLYVLSDPSLTPRNSKDIQNSAFLTVE